MAYKIFPCGGDKHPLIKDWQHEATDNPEKIRIWGEVFRERLKYWGIPTGPVNDLLVLDVDVKDANKNGIETIKANHLPLPPTRFQRTISGGLHYFFRYPRDGAQYGNRVNFLPGLDIRGVGGYVCFYENNPAPVADAPEWVVRPATKVSDTPQGPIYKVAPEIAMGSIAASLEAIREAPVGEANDTLNRESFKVGQLVASGSVTREYAFEILVKAAQERGKSLYEARATVLSGLDGGAKKPLTSPFAAVSSDPNFPPPPEKPARWTPPKITRHNLLNESKLRKPQLFKHWSTEDIQITTADGGTGKTTLKLVEAICLALGQPFLGFDCEQKGKTLFITGEDTQDKLSAMLGKILREMGLLEVGHENEVQTILDCILIKKDADLCLISKTRDGFLVPNPDAIAKVNEAIEDFNPKMIVFDPISSFWGSESAVNDMAKAVAKFCGNIVEKHNVCLELINHMGKASSQSKDMSQFAGRGGTGLPSHSRVARTMRQVPEDEYRELTGHDLLEGESAIACQISKFSDGSPHFGKPFLIVRKGWTFTRKPLSKKSQQEVEKETVPIERVAIWVKQQLQKNRHVGKGDVVAYFQSVGMSYAMATSAVKLLLYDGYMGERFKQIAHPDQTQRGQIIVMDDEKRD